ncbi:Asp23/Gls24 family envelope stress response protein [Gordonia phthalatica]|uniref:Asp23/Gls24 family envelope stress response protein n=1 Tax=Gordonia phthalatica TaxID=1136941 RepID=A0A0N9NEC6_9ACTN|nr:Asp23/Gls24 family envelope stress response protein [Gordonia phthalatica]ALG86036.1 hypothetical protein ACH46_17950 [Gordonia phthalatica]
MADSEPELRVPGRVIIDDTVFEKIALGAALDVAGVVRSDDSVVGRLGGLVSRETTVGTAYPRVSVETVGGAAHVVDLTLAVAWPSAIGQVCREARARVGDELLRLTGVRPVRVNVTVAQVLPRSSMRLSTPGFVELPDPDRLDSGRFDPDRPGRDATDGEVHR